MVGLAELHEEFFDEIGGVDGRLAQLVEAADITRWLNQGQRRLGWFVDETTDVTWAGSDRSVAMPADFVRVVEIVPATGTTVPTYREFGSELHFLDPDGASESGTARVFYNGRPAAITDEQDSELTDEGDSAIVAFALYRFFNKLAAGRADYRRYATIAGANAVDISELAALAERHLEAFEDARDSIPGSPSATFYGD